MNTTQYTNIKEEPYTTLSFGNMEIRIGSPVRRKLKLDIFSTLDNHKEVSNIYVKTREQLIKEIKSYLHEEKKELTIKTLSVKENLI